MNFFLTSFIVVLYVFRLIQSFKDRGAEVKRRKTDETLKKIGSDINKLFNSRREIVTNLVKDAEREAAKYSLELASKRSQGVFGSGESASKTTEEEATTDEEEQESARETTESVVTSVATERNDSFTISEIDEVTTIESNGTVVTSVTSMTNTVDVLDANENIETDQSIIDQFDSLATTIAAGPRPNIATNEVPLPDESDVSIGSTTNNNIDFSDTDSDNEIGIGGSDTLEPEEMVASSVIDSSRDGTNAENRPISGHTSSDSMMTNAEDWLRRTVASDNELISKVFKAENAFLKRKSRSAKRSKRATTVSIENQTPADPTKEMDKESPDDSRTVDAEAGGDILASQLMPEMWSRNEEDEFVVFRDVKKIYEPWRTLSNYSIPRKIDETPDDPEEQLQYERWKTWAPVQTITDPIFPNYELNFSFSGLHVPLNVYPQHNNTRNAIKWSATLDHSFRRNRLVEPNLNFQFFCSIDGFLRIFPLIKWRVPNLFFTADKYRKLYSNSARPWRPPTAPGSGSNVGTTVDRAQRHAASDESVGRSGRKVRPNVPIDPHSIDSRSDGNQPQHELPEVAEEDWITDDDVDDNDPSRSLDLYDCRMRDWFIKAAAPAKDIIVLADSSGSMRGERSKITQNVIINILETLTENDFVSVLRFSANVFAVHPCFGTRFVQADKRNVARFKDEILEMSDDNRLEEAQKAANFTEAFSVAFRMFKEQSRSQHGTYE